ncbi:MAG: SPOR domain-containing protein [Holophagae bacterium]|jgi:cell division septation protein DedD
MGRSYYVIELSARWLTVLLIALALLMVLAFGLGFGAARSVTSTEAPPAASPTPTPLVTTEILPDPTAPVASPTRGAPSATPRPAPPAPEPPTPVPATPTPRPAPKPTTAAASGFYVQVIASARRSTIDEARDTLDGLGFDRDHQQIVESEVADGNELFKLRVGPFPDRDSADRVVKRMRAADFPDAWVVVP